MAVVFDHYCATIINICSSSEFQSQVLTSTFCFRQWLPSMTDHQDHLHPKAECIFGLETINEKQKAKSRQGNVSHDPTKILVGQ